MQQLHNDPTRMCTCVCVCVCVCGAITDGINQYNYRAIVPLYTACDLFFTPGSLHPPMTSSSPEGRVTAVQ